MPVLVAVAGVGFDVLEDKGPIFSFLVLHVKISVFPFRLSQSMCFKRVPLSQ